MTVSPCEFPPRVLIICVLSAIFKNYNSFFLVLSPLIKSPYRPWNGSGVMLNQEYANVQR